MWRTTSRKGRRAEPPSQKDNIGVRASTFVSLAMTAVACSSEQLDALSEPLSPDATAGASADGAAGPDLDRTGALDAGQDGGLLPSSSEASTLACALGPAPLQDWTFDTSDQGWLLNASPGAQVVMGVADAGNPTPGSLEVDFVSPAPDAGGSTEIWVHEDMTAGDLSGRTVVAWVWLDRGASPKFLSFVQTETSYAWADNGGVELAQATWNCVSLSFSTPPFISDPAYDPTRVVRIGYEMIATTPFRLFIDSVRTQ